MARKLVEMIFGFISPPTQKKIVFFVNNEKKIKVVQNRIPKQVLSKMTKLSEIARKFVENHSWSF